MAGVRADPWPASRAHLDRGWLFTSPLVASFLLSHSNIDTVYPNSIQIYNMLIDDDSFGCLGVPTPLEMLKQQSTLPCDEIAGRSDRLRRSRTNVAELIEMNQQLAAKRDALRVSWPQRWLRFRIACGKLGKLQPDYRTKNGCRAGRNTSARADRSQKEDCRI